MSYIYTATELRHLLSKYAHGVYPRKQTYTTKELLTSRLVGATDKDMIVASRVTAIILIVVSIILEIVR